MNRLLSFFKNPFPRFITTFIVVFVLFFCSYTFINWLLITKTQIIEVNSEFIAFIGPLLLCLPITYFVFRPVVKKLNWAPKVSSVALWFSIPFSITIPVVFSQSYFRDISFSIITVEYATDVVNYPHERFFRIKNFFVDTTRVYTIREKHTSGKNGTTLNVSNFMLAPLFDNKTDCGRPAVVDYGIRFGTEMSNSLMYRKDQPALIEKFNRQCIADYENYDFYTFDHFEKQQNSGDASCFNEAWSRNRAFDKSVHPTVLVKKTGTLAELYETDMNLMKYSTGICLFVVFCFFLIVNYVKFDKVEEDEEGN